jgi:hypothetical protein
MVKPTTPSTAGSKFTKMARGLARDIEDEQKIMWAAAVRNGGGEANSLAQSTVHARKGKSRGGGGERNPFHDIGNTLNLNVRDRTGTPMGLKVHLPDVTGLTSAVASPAKNGQDYYKYGGREGPREAEGMCQSFISGAYFD